VATSMATRQAGAAAVADAQARLGGGAVAVCATARVGATI
jgi:hypothetical protein